MIDCRFADYTNAADAALVATLTNDYANDPWGGSAPLPPAIRQRLIPALAAHPGAMSLLAFQAGIPCGLANCFLGFSTFAAKPLLNIHDFYVVPAARGQGCADAMMQALMAEAARQGCCKLTLEVLAGNTRAQALYRRAGFSRSGQEPPGNGAEFWQRLIGQGSALDPLGEAPPDPR